MHQVPERGREFPQRRLLKPETERSPGNFTGLSAAHRPCPAFTHLDISSPADIPSGQLEEPTGLGLTQAEGGLAHLLSFSVFISHRLRSRLGSTEDIAAKHLAHMLLREKMNFIRMCREVLPLATASINHQ